MPLTVFYDKARKIYVFAHGEKTLFESDWISAKMLMETLLDTWQPETPDA